ncbi:MAG: hypothetical protein NTV58_17460 [Deltaproteobacteria bacterium]|nr:hypothetical protein [Deltaproteobacteria bacterium]
MYDLPIIAVFCPFLEKFREKKEKTDVTDWSDNDLLAVNESINRLREALDNFTIPKEESNLE